MAEIEHLAKRCTSCKHHYISPCGDDPARLKTCMNWNWLHNRPKTARVMPKKKGARVLPDHEGPILDKIQPLEIKRVGRVKRTKIKPKAKGKKR